MDIINRGLRLDNALCCVAPLGSSAGPALFVGLLES